MPATPPPLPRPTLRQVAALSGVSLKTASRVLNDEPHVAADTADRVRAAARRLGFRRNMLAREFRTGARTASVGLVIGDLANPFYARVARGAERRLRAAGFQLIIASTDEDPERERLLVDEMVDRRVRGILLVTCASEHDYVDDERRLGTPVVFVDRAPDDVRADTIVLDNSGGVERAVEHLVAVGHRRIGLIGDLARLPTQRERRAGFERGMRAAGLADGAVVVDGCHDDAAAERAATALLAAPDAPTALIAGNNRITLGALRALAHHEGVALVGFDDFEAAELLGISVIAHDPELMGEAAAEAVLAGRTDAVGIVQRTLETHLVVRASSRPPA